MSDPPAFGGGTFIADKSIWARAHKPAIRDEWRRALTAGQVITCQVTMLELLYSARTGAEFEAVYGELRGLVVLGTTESVCHLAMEALRELSHRSDGFHRVAPPDAIVAATAAENGIGVLHYDRDFDRLAEVLQFESRWAADPPALD